jgi:K(+)-stimulated pyrophosphate-energized sodium pump
MTRKAGSVNDALVALGFGRLAESRIFARSAAASSPRAPSSGGDLGGKVEAGIPGGRSAQTRDDRDKVGDNVGDCAGMAADLFETYAVTVVATMVLGRDLL